MQDLEERPRTTDHGLILRDVASEADLLAISKAARAEGHQTIAPTHIVEAGSGEQGAECVGYASLNAMPVLTGWLHGEAVSDEQADAIVNALAEEAREKGLSWLAMPCTEDCRFKDRMNKLGYRKIGPQLTMYLKVL